MMKREILSKRNLLLGLIFICFLIIGYMVPQNGDDWFWSSSLGYKYMLNLYAGYNGRYLSNTLAVFLLENNLIRALFFSTTLLFLLILTLRLIKKKIKFNDISILTVLFLLMPIKIFSETYGWMSAYIVYVFPTLLLLIILNLVKEQKKFNKFKFVSVFILSVLIQLNVEHITLFFLFSSFYFIVIDYIKNKKVYYLHGTILSGGLIGAFIMFTNSAYINNILGIDKSGNSRTIAKNTLFDSFHHVFVNKMDRFLFIQNKAVILILLIVLLLVINRKIKINIVVKWIINIYFIVYLVFTFYFENYLLLHPYPNKLSVLHSIASIGLMLLILIIVLNLVKEYKDYYVLYIYSGIFLLSAPFLIISPYGSRCAYNSFYFIILLIVYLYNKYLNNFLNFKKQNTIILVIILFSLMIMYMFPLYKINSYVIKRDNYINSLNYKKIKIIKIPKVPFPEYLHMPYPDNGTYRSFGFKEKYNMPKKIKFVIVKNWKEVYEK